ncbi:MAG TPA: DUF4350 domain-containing protein [Erythrobacter sp.]|nr:DUF4350 domain-containing protein [Erythrobacter sp.]
MSGARAVSPFSARAALAIVLVGFLSFVALLYFIAIGDTGGSDNDGGGHAAANGLNGYSGLVRLLELEGHKVTLSRSPGTYDTPDLLVLTPPIYQDPEKLGELLTQRKYIGPTLVILPKWYATRFPRELPPTMEGKVGDGWVQLVDITQPTWTRDLPDPYSFVFPAEWQGAQAAAAMRAMTRQPDKRAAGGLAWQGLGLSGRLPDARSIWATPGKGQDALVTDSQGHALALDVIGEEGSEFYEEAFSATFVIEPDLVNNYGLADRQRAALAVELVRTANYDDDKRGITFDLTLNGLGAGQNLLTLAFRPPFLAATLCLLLALLVVGWRAFRRFGPPIADAPASAFGKSRLIANGAGLVLRARRLQLLTAPYADLAARRLAKRLGLVRAEPAAIDAALAQALPDEEPFTSRAETLRHARRPAEILSAAEHLFDLERKLTR